MLCKMQSHSLHVHMCLTSWHGMHGEGLVCRTINLLRVISAVLLSAGLRAPAFRQCWHCDHKGSTWSLSTEREKKRSNFRLCSECISSAHIGNSTVPRSQCDLPVAHLLASVKCKSLRASVSAQYSQEHEGSCTEGRVRAGRQQGALSPPLSGAYRLKNLLI